MSIPISSLLGLAIGIGAIGSLFRVRSTDPTFYPFYFFLWAGFIHESGDWLLVSQGYITAWNDNVYALVSVMIGIWQFWEWGLWRNRDWVYLVLLTVLGLCWLVESCIRLDERSMNSWFLLISSLSMVLMSIWWISVLFYREDGILIRNPAFLICFGFLVFYSVFILVESTWVNGLIGRPGVYRVVYSILGWVKLVTSIVFGIAVKWVPISKAHIHRIWSHH